MASVAGYPANGDSIQVNSDGSISFPSNGDQIPEALLAGYNNVAYWRIHRHTATDGNNQQDNVLGLAYNAIWTQAGINGSWTAVDSVVEPSYMMGFESRWNGNIEWNLDVAAPGAVPGAWFRPWGFQSTLATKDTQGTIGYAGTMNGGIQVNAGPLTGYLWIRAIDGQNANNWIFALRHGTSAADKVFFKVHPTQYASVISQAGNDIGPAGYNGLVNILDCSIGYTIGGTVASDIALQTKIQQTSGGTDADMRYQLLTNGKMNWGPGNTAFDTDLYRSAVGLLTSDNNVQGLDGISTKAVAGAVSDASFTNVPPIGTIAVDTTGNIYAKTAVATWKKVAIA